VQLAYRYTVPRPQRTYRANRRGLAMTATQQKRAAAFSRSTSSDMTKYQTYAVYVDIATRNLINQKPLI